MQDYLSLAPQDLAVKARPECFCHRRGHTLPIRYGRQSALAKPELIAGIVQYHVGDAENEATAVSMEDRAGDWFRTVMVARQRVKHDAGKQFPPMYAAITRK